MSQTSSVSEDELSSSSPTEDSDLSDEDQNSQFDTTENICCCRISLEEHMTFEDVAEFLKDTFQKYSLHEEVKPKKHCHFIIVDQHTVEEVKLCVQSFVYNYWTPTKRKRGFGNQYYCKVNRKPLEYYLTYSSKDKLRHEYAGFTAEFIQECKDASYPKVNPHTFKSDLIELEKEFKSREMSCIEYMTRYNFLKAKNNQNCRVVDSYSSFISADIRKNGMVRAQEWSIQFLAKQ